MTRTDFSTSILQTSVWDVLGLGAPPLPGVSLAGSFTQADLNASKQIPGHVQKEMLHVSHLNTGS